MKQLNLYLIPFASLLYSSEHTHQATLKSDHEKYNDLKTLEEWRSDNLFKRDSLPLAEGHNYLEESSEEDSITIVVPQESRAEEEDTRTTFPIVS